MRPRGVTMRLTHRVKSLEKRPERGRVPRGVRPLFFDGCELAGPSGEYYCEALGLFLTGAGLEAWVRVHPEYYVVKTVEAAWGEGSPDAWLDIGRERYEAEAIAEWTRRKAAWGV